MLTSYLRYVPQILGFFLSANAGAINAISILQPLGVGVSHATGSFSHLSLQLVIGEPHALSLLLILLCFLGGSLVSGLALGGGEFDPHKRYGLVMMAEALLILAAHQSAKLIPGMAMLLFLAFACGMQNGLFTNYSKMVIRTTHLTGVLTDLGLTLGKALRSGVWNWSQIQLYLSLITGFFFGGVLGAMGWLRLAEDVFLINGVYVMGLGLVYYFFRRYRVEV